MDVLPGVQARVVQLTADAGFALTSMADREEVSAKDATCRWIAACVVDEVGEPVFSISEVGKLPFALVQKLAKAVNEANGLSTALETDDAEKNSGVARS